MTEFVPYTGETIPEEEFSNSRTPRRTPEFVPYEGESVDNRTLWEKVVRDQRQPTLEDDIDIARGLVKGGVNAVTGAGKTLTAAAETTRAVPDSIENSWLRVPAQIATNAATRITNPIGSFVDDATSAYNWATGTESTPGDATAAAEKILPDIPIRKGTAEEYAEPVGRIGTGVTVGTKGAGALTKSLKAAPKLSTKALGATADLAVAESVTAMMMDPNTDPTFFSKPATENDDPATARMKKAAVLAEDAFIAGVLGGAAGKAVGESVWYVGNWIKNIKDWRSMSAIQKEYVGIIMDRMAKIPEGASREEVQQAYSDVVEYMGKNSEITATFGKQGVADAKFYDDTISVIRQRLDPNDPEDIRILTQLDAIRSSALGGNKSGVLQKVIEKPDAAQGTALNQLDEVSGGRATAQNTQDAAIEQGNLDIATSKVPEYEKGQELSTVEKQTEDVMRSDPQLGPAIKSAEDADVTLGTYGPATEAQTKLTHAVKDVDIAAEKQTKEAFQDVRTEGAPADMRNFNSVLDAQREKLPPATQTIIDDAIGEGDGSFGHLYANVRPQIEDLIAEAKQQGKIREMKALIEVKANINRDQLDLAKQGTDEYGYSTRAAKAAEKADETYIGEQQVWDRGLAKDMRKNRLDNMPDPSNPRRPSDPLDFEEKGNELLISAIKNPKRAKSVQALRAAVKPESASLFDDVVVAEVAYEHLTKLTAKGGKLADADTGAILKSLDDMSAGLSGENKARLEKVFTAVRDGKLKGAALQKELNDLVTKGKAAEDKIYSDYLGDFVNRTTGQKISNPDQILKSIFDDAYSKDKLDLVIQAAKSDPTAMKGLEGAWARRAKEILNNNQSSVAKFPENFMDRGKQIFGEDGEVVINALDMLNKKAIKNYEETNIRMGGGFSSTQNQTNAVQGVNSVITWIFGVLNPRAAKIRTITSDLMKRNNSGEISNKAVDIILSDPKEFARIAKEVQMSRAKQLTDVQKKTLFRMMNNVAHYGGNPGDAAFDAIWGQTEAVFGLEPDVEFNEEDMQPQPYTP